ncbi:UDP-N-acetylglucosamine pyrophosphorylase [Candidatus Magnetomorum sp. HK-1]|nr:UDP-N-acetylglucosamine pyrophosphorylase [Candidatus Magnetomorum sp. HK-1]
MPLNQKNTIEALLQKGVNIPCPESVEIGNDINVDRISGENVTLHTGSKIYGEKTLILPGVTIGEEVPATVKNCFVGPNVRLKGGFFEGAVFLDHSMMGSGAHVRKGTILEEYASGAHTVGLKQTILFPFVTLGSLINFCDCLMAGGTNRKNHSEVGSSYIHFNYTPNQDKATPSLIGDVPNGVMINQSPIFLGGQGGLVGPCRIAYGTIIAAGSVYRKDILKENRLVMDGAMRHASISFNKKMYLNIQRIVENNIIYMSNLVALAHWYYHVRGLWANDPMTKALHEGLLETIQDGLNERIKQIKRLSEKMPESIEEYKSMLSSPNPSHPVISSKQALYERCDDLTSLFKDSWPTFSSSGYDQNSFLSAMEKSKTQTYIESIQLMDDMSKKQGVSWLQGIVDNMYEKAFTIIPECKAGIKHG